MEKMFVFDPRAFAPQLKRDDFVHIPGALNPLFQKRLERQIEEFFHRQQLDAFALGNKQQALYDFVSDEHYQEFLDVVGTLTGIASEQLVISERHIKSYEKDADPNPMPHKDRFATEFAVGFTVRNPGGSNVILYPHSHRGVNPFQSWAEFRNSLTMDQKPTECLRQAQPVRIFDQPGDMIVFRGNDIWHTRENGANTVMLYFKINSFHSDPIGEDPQTSNYREASLVRAAYQDEDLQQCIPILGRQVDCLQRRYNSQWQEVFTIQLFGQDPIILQPHEFSFLQMMDGKKPVHVIMDLSSEGFTLQHLKTLVKLGYVDLLASNQVPCSQTNDTGVTESLGST